jgi:hypothetical protein
MNEHYMFHMCSATINFTSTRRRFRYRGSLKTLQGEPAVAAGANGGRITSACANDRLANSELSW